MFDTKTDKFTEWPVPTHAWSYDVAFDKNGELWTGSMHDDRVVRVNPKNSQTVEYHCRVKPTCGVCSWTTQRRRSRSGRAAITVPLLSR